MKLVHSRLYAEPSQDRALDFHGIPIIGKEFGFGQFLLCAVRYPFGSLPTYKYAVVERESGTPLCEYKDTKGDALSAARRILRITPQAGLHEIYAEHLAHRVAVEKTKAEIERAEIEEERKHSTVSVRSISKKRRQIFESSNGKCHYCSAELTLTGGWHVEHKLPRSRGGTDLPDNLVASCVKCNFRKGRRTAEEFKPERPDV